MNGIEGLGMGMMFFLGDNFSKTADKIKAGMKDLDGVSDAVSKNISRSWDNLKTGAAMLAVGGAMVAALASPIKMAVGFEEGMAKINTTAQLTQPELQNLRNELMLMGKEGTSNINMIPEAYEKIISQTNDVTLSTDILKTSIKGAKAGFADVNVVAGALAQTLSIVGKGNTTSAEIMDTLFAAKRVGAGEFKDFAAYLPTLIAAGSNLGYTFKETSGIFAYFTSKGQDAASSAMLMQNAFSALQKVDIQKGLKKQGVNIFDETGKMRDVVSIFKDLNALTATMTQKQKTNLFDKVGLRDVQARNAFAILSSDVGKLNESMMATANPAGELGKALENGGNTSQNWEIALNKIRYTLMRLGQVFLPMVTVAVDVLGNVFGFMADVMDAISSNPIGRFILKLVGAVAALTTVLGSAIILISVKNMLVGKLAMSLIAMGKAELAATVMNNGLIGSLRVLAGAAWSALAPMMPMILIGAALVGVVVLLKKSFDSFKNVLDGTEEPATGFLGLMQRIGGVIYAVKEIFSTATSDGFTMSQKLHDGLEKLGILEFVLKLSTWIVRIKEFFKGLMDGFGQIWGVVKYVFNLIGSAFNWLMQKLSDLGLPFAKLGGDMKGFAKAGKILAWVIGVPLLMSVVGIAIALGSMAVAVIAATWPILLIIGVIYGIVQVIRNWGSIVDWIAKKWTMATLWIQTKISDLVNWFKGLPHRMYQAGADMVQRLKDGVMAKWDAFKGWLRGKLSFLGSWNPMGEEQPDLSGEAAGQMLPATTAPSPSAGNTIRNETNAIYNNPVQPNFAMNQVLEQHTNTFVIPVHVGGDQVAEHVFDQQSLEHKR